MDQTLESMKRKNSINQVRLFSLKDISAIGKLVAGLFVVLVVPERYWHSLSRAVIRVVCCFDRKKRKMKERLVEAILGGRLKQDPERLVLENAALKYLSKLQILKGPASRIRWKVWGAGRLSFR